MSVGDPSWPGVSCTIGTSWTPLAGFQLFQQVESGLTVEKNDYSDWCFARESVHMKRNRGDGGKQKK